MLIAFLPPHLLALFVLMVIVIFLAARAWARSSPAAHRVARQALGPDGEVSSAAAARFKAEKDLAEENRDRMRRDAETLEAEVAKIEDDLGK